MRERESDMIWYGTDGNETRPKKRIFATAIVTSALAAAWVGRIVYAKKAEKESLYDTMTGIGNKAYFRHRFEQVFDHVKRCCGVVYIGFPIEQVNEIYGEENAERRLCYAAGKLVQLTRDKDILARVSGGGFGIVRPWNGEEEFDAWIRQVLEQLNQYDPVSYRDGTRFYAGVCQMGTETQDCETVLYCSRKAYLCAMHENIDYKIFPAVVIEQERENWELKRHFLQAIENREFKLFLQWIVNRENQEIVGAEALSRWKHPQKGWLYPSSYITLIESEKNPAELDFYMFEEACRLLEQWERKGRSISVSSNFTRITIGQPDFVRRIREICSKYEFVHRNLVLEITEDAMEIRRETAFENISRCKELGFRIALDDVGSGNTSFADLSNYLIDIVKIDRTVLLAAVDDQGIALMKGMIDLAHSLNMKVLCEGIETEEQRDLAYRLGCDYMQGFLFCKAISVKEADQFLEENDSAGAGGQRTENG